MCAAKKEHNKILHMRKGSYKQDGPIEPFLGWLLVSGSRLQHGTKRAPLTFISKMAIKSTTHVVSIVSLRRLLDLYPKGLTTWIQDFVFWWKFTRPRLYLKCCNTYRIKIDKSQLSMWESCRGRRGFGIIKCSQQRSKICFWWKGTMLAKTLFQIVQQVWI